MTTLLTRTTVAVVLPPVRPATRAEDAARRFVAEYVSYSWREPQGAAARRAAAYATLAFGRELVAGTRPYAGWTGVVERQEEARGIVEAAYRDGDEARGTDVAVTVLVRVDVASTASLKTSRQALAARVAVTDGGWLVSGIEQ